jgi:DNA repair protein RadC
MADKQVSIVKAWPDDERSRMRLIPQGVSSLSEAQLRTIIIRIRGGFAGRKVVNLGMYLLEKFGKIANIGQTGIKEPRTVRGIGPAKAAGVQAEIGPGRRYEKPGLVGASLYSSEAVAFHYRPRMKNLKREMFRCVLFDTKNKGIQHEIAYTSLTAPILRIQKYLQSRYSGICSSCHLYPQPSKRRHQAEPRGYFADTVACSCGDVIGIQVLDHGIVGGGCHFNFGERVLSSASLSGACMTV